MWALLRALSEMGSSASTADGLTVEQELRLIVEYFQARRMTVRDAFIFLDMDGSGFVSWEEFLRGINLCTEGLGRSSLCPAALMPVFNRFDVNCDGRLSIEEFAAAFGPVAGTPASIPGYSLGRRRPPSPGASAWQSARLLPDGGLQEKMAQDIISRIASSVIRTGCTPEALFARLDVDQNGRLSCAELQQVLLSFEPNLSRSDCEAVHWRFDKDQSGGVDISEFYQALQDVNAGALVAVEDKVQFLRAKLQERGCTLYDSFAIFDRNGDGYLSREEWQRAMSVIGPELSTNDLEAVFRLFDVNGDGHLSIAEFQEFFQNAIDLRPSLPPPPPTGTVPVYQPPPVEAPWEAEVLDLVRTCLCSSRSGLSITEVFRRLDISGSNSMTPFEFNRMVRAYRPGLTQEQLESLFYKVNTSRSGAITLGEFVRRFG